MPTERQLWNFSQRHPKSVPGKYYVGDACMICAACQNIAPTLFDWDTEERQSYVRRQPVTAQETALAEEAAEVCCTGAINSDGLEFDWEQYPASKPWSQLTDAEKEWVIREERRIKGLG